MTDCHEFVEPGITNPKSNRHSADVEGWRCCRIGDQSPRLRGGAPMEAKRERGKGRRERNTGGLSFSGGASEKTCNKVNIKP